MIDGTQKVYRAIIVASFARSVQIVQVVPIVKSPFLILPRDAGEDEGEGLIVLNSLNDLNGRRKGRHVSRRLTFCLSSIIRLTINRHGRRSPLPCVA